MKKIFLFISLAAMMALTSCEIEEYFRSDTMTSTQLKADPSAAVYTTDGNYAMFKDQLEYKGSTDSGNTYIRHYFQMGEFRGDNACLSGRTSDCLYEAFNYTDNGTLKNVYYFWWVSYKIIYGANSNIEAIQEGMSDEADHMKGENYFMRAFCHLGLINVYAKPYSCGRDNPGVVLRTSTDCSVTERATVGAVYDQIVADLQEASRLMKGKSSRGDKGYISYETSQALLSRVHLYMENNTEVLSIAQELLGGGDGYDKLDTDLPHYVANARTSKETLWCIVHVESEDRARSSVGSMYYSPNGTGGIGWGEIYWSDPLLELMGRYKDENGEYQDNRLKAYFEQYATKDDDMALVHWPFDQGPDSNWRANETVVDVKKNAEGKWAFNKGGKDYVVEEKDKDGDGFNEYYINGAPSNADKDKDGDTRVYVHKNCDKVAGIRQTFPLYQMKKFATSEAQSNLSSPVMIRYAEVILNAAEAEAKAGSEANALKYVNAIRRRAGIPEWNDSNKWSEHGYDNLLDVVLDERRMELCFEGHRSFDVWRNRKSMDRRFAGAHPWEVVEYTDNRIPYTIPLDETDVSGIPQNDKNN